MGGALGVSRQTRNWISAILAVGLLIVFAAILGALSGQRSADPFLHRPSTFFTDASGARALLLVLERLLPSAEQWRRPLNLLPPLEDEGSPDTLIVAGPSRALSRVEAESLDRWLTQGGQLILATADGWAVGRGLAAENKKERPSNGAKAPQEAAGPEPVKRETYLSRHAPGIQWSKPGELTRERITGSSVPMGELMIQWQQKFASTAGAKIVAAAGEAALAVEIPVGKGRIVAIADPTIVSNRALRESDSAIWLVTLAAAWGNGRVLVDEFHHGFGEKRSVSALTWAFLQTPWGWFVAQLIAAGLLYVFGYRRRFGRVFEPPAPQRASPLELVDARAGLFQAAAAQKLAVELICQNLSQELGRVHNKSVELSRLTHSLEVLNKTGRPADLSTRLKVLSSKTARGEKLTAREFVEVGRVAGQILQGPPQ